MPLKHWSPELCVLEHVGKKKDVGGGALKKKKDKKIHEPWKWRRNTVSAAVFLARGQPWTALSP